MTDDASPDTGEETEGGTDGLTAALPGLDLGDEEAAGQYQVLARKYRPSGFSDLVGQEAMVRTLTNAFASGRLAHAFVLTGVRGVGKTTTARIIARALNCVGPDGTGGPTIEPCGVCENCRAIAEDRHVDVLEMDAASRTGVDDIRELIEGVRYRPVSARYKVYIIDEVHMLSRNAFNALLKTLEEPPEHVKFIFATTEIRKVPITVLSRCQRFDLRRIGAENLSADFARIAATEGAAISDRAIRLIARAADGSHRDGLSILDQVITTGAGGGGEISEDQVRDMLGLADRTRGFDLLEAVFAGDAVRALDILEDDYRNGADPMQVLQDLLEITHWLTRIKLVPAAAEAAGVPEAESERGSGLAGRLGMGALARAWQMLLKGVKEAQGAPSVVQAVEMILIRLAYASELPTPEEALKKLDGGGSARGSSSPPAPAASAPRPGNAPAGVVAAEPATASPPEAVSDARPHPTSLAEVIALAETRGQPVLKAQLINNVRPVHFEPGRIEFSLEDGAPQEIVGNLAKFLHAETGERWMVSLSNQPGGQTAAQKADAETAEEKAAIAETPLVKSILETFPGATIETVRRLGPETAAQAGNGGPAGDNEGEPPE